MRPLKQNFIYPPYILILSIGALLLPFIYSDSILHKATLPKYIFIALISISSFFAWVLSGDNSKAKPYFYNHLYSFLLLIFIFSASSILWGKFKGTYQLEILHFSCLILVTFISMQIKNIKHIQVVLFFTILGAASATFLAFLQIWGWNPLHYNSPSFPASAFINKNHLSNYIDLLIPISLFLLATLESNKKKYVISICISILFSYLIFSHTRASWLSLVIVFIIILVVSYKTIWIQKKFKETNYKHVILIIFLSFFLINSPGDKLNEEKRFETLYSSLEKSDITSSTSMRINAYKNAIAMFSDSPFLGTGLGSFYIAFKPYDKRKQSEFSTYTELHSDPLQIILELGLIGGLLVSLFIFMVFYLTYEKIINSSTTQNNIKNNIISTGLLLTLTVSIIHSFIDFPLHLPASSFLLFLFVGLLLGTNKSTKIYFHKAKSFFLLATIVIFTLNINFYNSFIDSSYKINKAIKIVFSHNIKGQYKPKPVKQLNDGACTAAINHTDKALNQFSSDFFIQNWAYVIYKQCVTSHSKFIELSKKVLTDNPYHRVALENIAFALFNKEKYSSSKHYYQILHYTYPFNAGYALLLGHIETKQKNYHAAYTFYKNSLLLSPQNTVAPKMIQQLKVKGYIK